MKRYTWPLLVVFLTVSLLLSGCSSPTTVSPTNTQPQATATIEASATTAPPTNTAAPTNTTAPTASPAPTNTPLPAAPSTPTQAPQATATAGTPAVTPTAPPSGTGGAIAHINENTNCRNGPSADYPLVFTFMSGDSAAIVSKTTIPDYIVVGVPNNSLQTCWLWTQYVTTIGDLASLPVATLPPPLVAFTLAFTRIQVCDGFAIEIKVLNTGTKTIQAYTVVAKDLTSHTQQTTSSTVFDFREECLIAQAIGYIDPGKTGYIYASNFTYDPTGHSMEADVTICSRNDMTGVCVNQVYKFTP